MPNQINSKFFVPSFDGTLVAPEANVRRDLFTMNFSLAVAPVYIQLVYKPHFGRLILLSGAFGQLQKN